MCLGSVGCVQVCCAPGAAPTEKLCTYDQDKVEDTYGDGLKAACHAEVCGLLCVCVRCVCVCM